MLQWWPPAAQASGPHKRAGVVQQGHLWARQVAADVQSVAGLLRPEVLSILYTVSTGLPVALWPVKHEACSGKVPRPVPRTITAAGGAIVRSKKRSLQVQPTVRSPGICQCQMQSQCNSWTQLHKQHGRSRRPAWHTYIHGGVGSMWQLQPRIPWLQRSVQSITADQQVGLRETAKVVSRVGQPHLQAAGVGSYWHSAWAADRGVDWPATSAGKRPRGHDSAQWSKLSFHYLPSQQRHAGIAGGHLQLRLAAPMEVLSAKVLKRLALHVSNWMTS